MRFRIVTEEVPRLATLGINPYAQVVRKHIIHAPSCGMGSIVNPIVPVLVNPGRDDVGTWNAHLFSRVERIARSIRERFMFVVPSAGITSAGHVGSNQR